MIPQITQENVRLFIPYKVSKICDQLCKESNISVIDALLKFYRSKTARLLQQESTKVWTEGWVGVYTLFKGER